MRGSILVKSPKVFATVEDFISIISTDLSLYPAYERGVPDRMHATLFDGLSILQASSIDEILLYLTNGRLRFGAARGKLGEFRILS